MKQNFPLKLNLLTAIVAFAGSAVCTQAGGFSTNFDDGLVPDGTAVYGSAFIDGVGGVNNSGCLKLTTTTASTSGSFIINDLDAGVPVVSFAAGFKMTMGGGTRAGDGFSFNFAANLPTGPISHEGAGTGLTIEFDTYFNGGADTAPSIDVKVAGTEVAKAFAPQLMTTTGNYVDVQIQLNPDLTLTVIYDGIYAYSNLDLSAYLLPAVYPFTGAQFGFGSQNGGSTANKFVDDLNIVTRTNATAFVRSFRPLGRRTQPSSAIDITLTNSNTSVNSSSIALQLDGATVSPSLSTAGGQTFIHYAPPAAFGPYTAHTVNLVFGDDASPTPNTNTVQYSFSIPATSYVTLFSDGFESYTAGGAALDKNTAGPNAAPNGSGNPWFGPLPPNFYVVATDHGVAPHGGSQMIRPLYNKSAPFDLDELWYNLPYRLNGGNFYTGNIMLDWWFYDPLGSGGSNYKDFGAIGYYNTEPNNTDFPGAGSLNGSGSIQRLSLGTYTGDTTKYQARSVAAQDGNSGGNDWFNTTTTRSVGWHHARVIVGATIANGFNYVDYYIDDMNNPTFWHMDMLAYGYNVIELNGSYGSISGWFDDVSFAVGRPPNLTVTLSGNNAVITWPGLDFTLQSATDVTGPYADVTGATSGYNYDVTTTPTQFFRLRQM